MFAIVGPRGYGEGITELSNSVTGGSELEGLS